MAYFQDPFSDLPPNWSRFLENPPERGHRDEEAEWHAACLVNRAMELVTSSQNPTIAYHDASVAVACFLSVRGQTPAEAAEADARLLMEEWDVDPLGARGATPSYPPVPATPAAAAAAAADHGFDLSQVDPAVFDFGTAAIGSGDDQGPVGQALASPVAQAPAGPVALASAGRRPKAYSRRAPRPRGLAHNNTWTEEESQQLRRLREAGESYKAIGEALGRSAAACETRGKNLGVYKGGRKQ